MFARLYSSPSKTTATVNADANGNSPSTPESGGSEQTGSAVKRKNSFVSTCNKLVRETFNKASSSLMTKRHHNSKPKTTKEPGIVINYRQQYPGPDEVDPVGARYKTIILDCRVIGCEALFRNMAHLDDHMETVHKCRIRCAYYYCKFRATEMADMSAHYLAQHGNIGKLGHIPWTCYYNKCGLFFATGEELMKHFVLFHHTGEFACVHPECEFRAGTRVAINIHYAREHQLKQLIEQSLKMEQQLFGQSQAIGQHQMMLG